jgi:phage terminase Nu1 subunit (DNA packaging protein)
MIILWIRKRKASEPNGNRNNDNNSAQKHDEIMRRFRLTHPQVDNIHSKDIMTADGNLLAPIQKVKLTENVKN